MLLILCIGNSDQAYKKRRKNHNIYKRDCVTVLPHYLFYVFLWSYLINMLLIYHHTRFHGKT